MPETGRFLGVDFGTRRIGLAVSDPSGAIAFPAGTLERRGLRRDLESLCALVKEREVARIVVGLPLHMDGREGDMARGARAFATALGERAGLPVELLDERWTSREAEQTREHSAGAKRKRRRRERGDVDAAAATLLLSTWLERARAEAPA